ncbi:DUF3566 domain-containing protein [Paenarthrobacter sp. DKR-5]|uniref:DUF3566 domain-containing protein n=1 Tax=Paenarthrobacter sp. DKR-5 TaxID=2835535 RepID=UPI001BDC4730|nr:DUF3566 domain-containing protein [Paenarthrobacter sp. DKR-5]MBT1003999.1 DUF3566 domain-containing protein [Paenarthrobacter sp. DKR-5]
MISIGQVAAFATVLALVNTVVLTITSTVAAMVYNAGGQLVGGVSATLADG